MQRARWPALPAWLARHGAPRRREPAPHVAADDRCGAAGAAGRTDSPGGELDWPTVLASLELMRHGASSWRIIAATWDAATARCAWRWIRACSGVATPAQVDKLAQALSAYLGQSVRVGLRAAAQRKTASPARQRELQAEGRQTAARAAFAADPAVQALQQQFGATIHADSVRPLGKE